jgi:7-carboxy-7-deazaguanine synthase
MLISEIFHSIQGEGEFTGVPSVFIRTSGCNLRCRWCDTPYASWNPEGEQLSVPQIVERVKAFDCSYVVLTGGEPMMAKGIEDLAGALRALGKHITMETASTVPPAGIACDLASLSPKLSNSTPDTETGAWRERHEESRWRPEIAAAWMRDYRFQLKFVVAEQRDVEEIERFIEETQMEIPNSKVLLMPEGTSIGVIRGRSETLVDLCLRKGYRYCNRLQIELFGNTRGT